MHNLLDLMNIVDNYITYLKENNFHFDDDGFPIFKKEMFLR